jgi:hypothetical protein
MAGRIRCTALYELLHGVMVLAPSREVSRRVMARPTYVEENSLHEDQLDRDTMCMLVSNGGRCTTFTIQVAQELEDRQDNGDLRDSRNLSGDTTT